jgi:RHS repeat-associated protein
MPSRTTEGGTYRYGFNGKEKDTETDLNDFGARFYAANLGRWLSIDPLATKFPNWSPYNAMNDNPMFFIDPDGQSGEPVIDKKNKTITIYADFFLYGDIDEKTAHTMISNAEKLWNDANGKVKIGSIEYSVHFVFTSTIAEEIDVDEVADNKNFRNNYIKLEKDHKNLNCNHARGDVSCVDGIGSNTGVWHVDDVLDGRTTPSHEIGHGFGLAHPDDDARGKGQPPIMLPRGTLVDADYTMSPSEGKSTLTISLTEAGRMIVRNPLNPNTRKVTQQDIDKLGLDKIEYDSQTGKGKLGGLTNQTH